ncbi:hypothetical protein FQ377_04875 [Arthrobacter echini]|uniref:Primosomal protein n=1 Tax=Arthrobacter echini TaxID=1529066 RepID=A0A5D0XRP8_9MICC|nr:hypothetical protein [Arthrobacter echini]TYC99324.1 hypothetical protein FQ377_04875 [Arthrobacter echini]
MSIDPRVALESLVSALEEHLASSASRRQEDDPAVDAAYRSIAAAFEVYEEALYDAFGEVTPLEIYEETDEDDEDDEDDDEDREDEESGYVAELIDEEVEPVPES